MTADQLSLYADRSVAALETCVHALRHQLRSVEGSNDARLFWLHERPVSRFILVGEIVSIRGDRENTQYILDDGTGVIALHHGARKVRQESAREREARKKREEAAKREAARAGPGRGYIESLRQTAGTEIRPSPKRSAEEHLSEKAKGKRRAIDEPASPAAAAQAACTYTMRTSAGDNVDVVQGDGTFDVSGRLGSSILPYDSSIPAEYRFRRPKPRKAASSSRAEQSLADAEEREALYEYIPALGRDTVTEGMTVRVVGKVKMIWKERGLMLLPGEEGMQTLRDPNALPRHINKWYAASQPGGAYHIPVPANELPALDPVTAVGAPIRDPTDKGARTALLTKMTSIFEAIDRGESPPPAAGRLGAASHGATLDAPAVGTSMGSANLDAFRRMEMYMAAAAARRSTGAGADDTPRAGDRRGLHTADLFEPPLSPLARAHSLRAERRRGPAEELSGGIVKEEAVACGDTPSFFAASASHSALDATPRATRHRPHGFCEPAARSNHFEPIVDADRLARMQAFRRLDQSAATSTKPDATASSLSARFGAESHDFAAAESSRSRELSKERRAAVQQSSDLHAKMDAFRSLEAGCAAPATKQPKERHQSRPEPVPRRERSSSVVCVSPPPPLRPCQSSSPAPAAVGSSPQLVRAAWKGKPLAKPSATSKTIKLPEPSLLPRRQLTTETCQLYVQEWLRRYCSARSSRVNTWKLPPAFTARYLRRVPRLRTLVRRFVHHEMLKKAARQKAQGGGAGNFKSRETIGAKARRVFDWVVLKLWQDGFIVLAGEQDRARMKAPFNGSRDTAGPASTSMSLSSWGGTAAEMFLQTGPQTAQANGDASMDAPPSSGAYVSSDTESFSMLRTQPPSSQDSGADMRDDSGPSEDDDATAGQHEEAYQVVTPALVFQALEPLAARQMQGADAAERVHALLADGAELARRLRNRDERWQNLTVERVRDMLAVFQEV